MNSIFKQLLNQYDLTSCKDVKYPLAEVLQKLILASLSKIDFFDKVVFCGGTSLRIFYGLNRFSEDLDFNLIESDKDFKLSEYCPKLIDILKSFGLDFSVSNEKDKTNVQKAILVINLYALINNNLDSKFLNNIRHNQTLKIKLEVDTNPPKTTIDDIEDKLLYEPMFCKIKIFKIETLFAGKINAILTRSFTSEYLKGRDYYDYLFYMSKHITPNLTYLQYSLSQFKMWDSKKIFKIQDLKDLLSRNFETFDVNKAKADVLPLIKNENELDQWTNEIFKLTLKDLN